MQFFYERLYRLALKGMNYGNAGNYKTSGELNVLHYIREKFPSGRDVVVFDVGANVGHYAQTLAAVFNSNIRIHTFEPSKQTFERLIKNTTHIGKIIPNNFGLSNEEHNVTLYYNTKASGLASLYQRDLVSLNISLDKTEEVQMGTLDSYCEKNGIEMIDFLKLDVEGHELKALQGAKRMLDEERIKFIQFEFGGTNIDSRTFIRDFFYLLRNKYKIYRVLRDGLQELPNYNVTRELFTSVNYLAEHQSDNQD